MDSRSIGVPEFKQRKQNIQNFFQELAEKRQQEQRLKNTVAEFFSVQASFHEKTAGFVKGLTLIMDSLSADEQALLKSYMQPYAVLSGNPFWTRPTGDLEKDLAHILSVVKKRNDHLSLIFANTIFCGANLLKFQNLLAKISLDASLASVLKEAIKTPQWQIVESCVVLPYQNACRYKLLLVEVEKQLQRAGSNDATAILQEIGEAITVLKHELGRLNDHKDTLQQLNEVDYLLVQLLDMDSVLGCNYKSQTGFDAEFLLNQVRVHIAGIKRKIATEDIDYVDQLNGTLALLNLVKPVLIASIQQEKDSYYQSAYNALERVADAIVPPPEVLSKFEQDPRYLMVGKIEELSMRLDHIVKNSLHKIEENKELLGLVDDVDKGLWLLFGSPAMKNSSYKNDGNLNVADMIAQARGFIVHVKNAYAVGAEDANQKMIKLYDMLKPMQEAVEQSLKIERESLLVRGSNIVKSVPGVTFVKETIFGSSEVDEREQFLTALAHIETRAEIMRIAQGVKL